MITVDDHFIDDETCPFPLQVDAVGHMGYHPRFNKAGDLIGESFTPSIRFLVTNPANGRSVTDADVGLDKARFLPDGSVEVLSTGIHAKARTDQNARSSAASGSSSSTSTRRQRDDRDRRGQLPARRGFPGAGLRLPRGRVV